MLGTEALGGRIEPPRDRVDDAGRSVSIGSQLGVDLLDSWLAIDLLLLIFTIVQAGLDRIIFTHNMKEEDAIEIRNGWEIAKRAVFSGKYQLIVMDEANIAIDLGLIPLEEMKELLANKPPELEIVLTGRRAHPEIIEMAHLVSEIRPIKHYWDIGVKARRGIEY